MADNDARPTADLTQAVLREVGPRLRAIRLKRDLTLDALAETTGISASTLSRLESGKRAPNLELLLPVTRALRIGLDDLLVWRSSQPAPVRALRSRRCGGLTVEYLSPDSAPVHVLLMTFAPSAEPAPTRSHDGRQWFHVLRGRVRIVVGEEVLTVGAGQSAEFDARIPHSMSASGGDPVEVLAMFSPTGADPRGGAAAR